jgi:phenylacetate-CoA ligase
MLNWYLKRIRRWRPLVLSGLPTYLQLLARHIERSGEEPPSIGSLLPEGALSTPALKNELTRGFGAPVHEVYGGHEFGGVSSTCERGDKMHIAMWACLVETVRGGRHVAPGELGEIVVTAFANRTMPLIRYRPGDVGRLYEHSCPCGRQTQLLTLQGRLQDMIVTSRGPRTAQEIIDFLAAWPNVEFAQLVQRTECRCDLLLVEEHPGRTNLHDVADAVADFLGEEMQVRPRLVSTIKPEASGKFRFVKSTSYERFHEARPGEASRTTANTLGQPLSAQAQTSAQAGVSGS